MNEGLTSKEKFEHFKIYFEQKEAYDQELRNAFLAKGGFDEYINKKISYEQYRENLKENFKEYLIAQQDSDFVYKSNLLPSLGIGKPRDFSPIITMLSSNVFKSKYITRGSIEYQLTTSRIVDIT